MIVTAKHPETGKEYEVNIPSLTESDLDEMIKEHSTDDTIRRYIENLNISAEAKAILYKLSVFTISIGGKILKFGKKVLEIIIMLVSKYKKAALGLIVGALLSVLIGSIPWIGISLKGFLSAWLMLYGLGRGLWEDLKGNDADLAASIVSAGEVFSPLAKAENPT